MVINAIKVFILKAVKHRIAIILIFLLDMHSLITVSFSTDEHLKVIS